MSEWTRKQFREIADLFDGPHATPKPSTSGPNFLGIKSITPDGKIDFSAVRHISWEEYPKWTKRVIPHEGDIVFSYEATLHQYCMIPANFVGCLGRRMALLRIKSEESNNVFVYHYLRSSKWKAYIEQKIIHGSTVDRISIQDFPEYEIELPERKTQDKIVSIISSYDDLIENNNRRIAILEEMAQKLYREWLVHFRFPGYENVKMVESAVGLTPADWRSYCVADIARFIKGKKPSDITNDQQAGYVKNILLDAIASGEYKFVNPQKMVLVEPNDIIMVMDGASSGKVFSGECGAVGSTLAKISTPDEYRFVLFMYLASHESSIMDNNTGSAIPHANKDFVNMMRLTIPNDGLLTRFNNIIGEYMHEKQLLRDKNMNLRKTRDLLLPRLISGDIDVSKFDILIKEG